MTTKMSRVAIQKYNAPKQCLGKAKIGGEKNCRKIAEIAGNCGNDGKIADINPPRKKKGSKAGRQKVAIGKHNLSPGVHAQQREKGGKRPRVGDIGPSL